MNKLKQYPIFGLCLVFCKSPSAHDPLGVCQSVVFLQVGFWSKYWSIGRAVRNPKLAKEEK